LFLWRTSFLTGSSTFLPAPPQRQTSMRSANLALSLLALLLCGSQVHCSRGGGYGGRDHPSSSHTPRPGHDDPSSKPPVLILPGCCPYLELPNQGESFDQVERWENLSLSALGFIVVMLKVFTHSQVAVLFCCRCEYNTPAETPVAPPQPNLLTFDGTLGPKNCPVACPPTFFSVRYPRSV
jgi:hypothetical protein